MQQNILDYIASQRIAVFAVEMLNGSPHGATVHFAHSVEPFMFIFETSARYRKSEPLLERSKNRATLVIGFTEGTKEKTFQADGVAELTQDPLIQAVYLDKFPEKKEKASNPENIFFTFTPSWWRFTDWGADAGKTIVTSDVNMAD